VRGTVVAVAVLLLAGFGSSKVVVEGNLVSSPYDGPMSLPLDHSDGAPVMARAGAAGRALECDGRAYDGGGADYDSGLASFQDSAGAALENLFKEDRPSSQLPLEGYRVEREDGGRVLLPYDVHEKTKVAFVVSDDIGDYDGGKGWGVEAWAQCDPAELPASVTEALDIEVWHDASGARVPLATIRSFRGPKHCDWQNITFLRLGPEATADEYLRDPTGELAAYVTATYDATSALPLGAKDTGFHHYGRQLWLSAGRDAAYLVSMHEPNDVQRWPAATRPIGCA
jgi:hypothetical protein